MVGIAEPATAVQSIEATLNYFRDTGEKPFTSTGGPGLTRHAQRRRAGPATRRRSATAGSMPTVRARAQRLPLRAATTPRSPTSSTKPRSAPTYYPEMEALVKAQTGAARVVVFDHTLRTADDAAREARKIREVVRRVHNDYTEWSGPQRVRDLLPQEAEALLRRRFAIVQVWRPIRYPVETFPLAICDAQSLSPADLVVSERRYPGRIGQTYAITHNPAHRWYWFPQMRREEALVFKVYDSIKDGSARWTAHTAFEDPTAPPGARPRESIEIRTLALF